MLSCIVISCLIFLALGAPTTPPPVAEPVIEIDPKCTQDPDPGNGKEVLQRYFYDRINKECKKFDFTGEGGNDNNFEDELSCLNDCYVDVNPLSSSAGEEEEDVTFIGNESNLPTPNCSLPKDSGNGNDNVQKFYYNPEWRSCFAFVYTGKGGNTNRFDNRKECESACTIADGSVCIGPSQPGEMTKTGLTCEDSECAEGYKCSFGFRLPECCKADEAAAVALAYDEKCPDGTNAGGIFDDYFLTTFAASCEDLLCEKDQSCIQVHPKFAKCCGQTTPAQEHNAEKRLADDVIDVEADECDSTEKRGLAECRYLLTGINIERRSGNLFTNAAQLIRDFNIACSKFDEYKTCTAMVTRNVRCLDARVAKNEQLLNFVCQDNVKEDIVQQNTECIMSMSTKPSVQNCERALHRSLRQTGGDICRALDRFLKCTREELIACSRSALVYVSNIITTIKANLEECRSDLVDDNESFVRPSAPQSRVRVSSRPTSPPLRQSARQCPTYIMRSVSQKCYPMLRRGGLRNVIGNGKTDFVMINLNRQNINNFCTDATEYRGCIETYLASTDACLPEIKLDSFYSFIVAFQDKFCERPKQVTWLINYGCISEVTSISTIQRCLASTLPDEYRILCRIEAQFDDCLTDAIRDRCRPDEVKFFQTIVQSIAVRSSYCTPLPPSEVVSDHASPNYEFSIDEDSSEVAVTVDNSCHAQKLQALSRRSSYVPECRRNGYYAPLQCDRINGTCFCVDEETGKPIKNTFSSPADQLPLCGLKAIFTCNKLPSRSSCDADRRKPQQVVRWYRLGDRCSAYLYDYCRQQSHLPPMPLRSQRDCERFCLE